MTTTTKPTTKPPSQGTLMQSDSPQAMTTRLIDRNLIEQADRIDNIARECNVALAETAGHMAKALVLAQGIAAIKKALTREVMSSVMELMNTPNGFITDRGPGKKDAMPYDMETVRECFITALINGFYPTSNEWNIIKGNFFGAKNGWKRKCQQISGMTDLDVRPGVPTVHNGQQCVRVAATWRYNGAPMKLMGADGKEGMVYAIGAGAFDNVIGKAERRAYRDIYCKTTGTQHTPDGDVSEPNITGPALPPPTTRTEQLTQKLAGENGNGGKLSKAQLHSITEYSKDWDESEFLVVCQEAGATTPEALTSAQADALIRRLHAQREEGSEERAAMQQADQ